MMDFEVGDVGAFGELLARYRTQTRISQGKLAACLKVHRNTVVKWEQGDSLPKDRTRIEEIVRCLKLREQERDALFRAALLTTPRLIQNLPFLRNPFFTGRDQELEQIYTELHQRTTAVIGQMQSISGLGGIGKTQLAVEYAYRHLDEYQYVLWVRAAGVEALTTSFTEIAHLLKLPEKDAQEQAKTLEAVKRWMKQQREWLLILDNVDSPSLLPDFLPPTVGGHLLITTRAADLSTQIAGLAHSLVVDTFSDEQGALFLLHRSGLLALNTMLEQAEDHIRNLACSIAHELGGLPLALDQAGAYLKAIGCDLATYEQIYRQRRVQLLKERRGADHPEPVATTWNLSFQKVEEQNPAAADLLRLCAFLAPDAIPEEIITQGAVHLGPRLAPIAADGFLLGQAMEALRVYSLIGRDPSRNILSLHRLVQAVLRDAMDASERQCWAERTIRAVHGVLPAVEHSNWLQWERVLAHALACTEWIEQLGVHVSETTELLHQTGWYLTKRARYGKAEPLLEGAYRISGQEQGAEDLDTARDALALAELYRRKGEYAEAEPLYRQALLIYEQQLGPVHPDTATGLNNLALFYKSQGKYAEAEPLYQQVLSIYEQQLGLVHPGMAIPLNNLAELYRNQGKYAEAEPLYRRALLICELQLGPAHPDTATCLDNLAELYRNQGKYAEAEPLYWQALSTWERVYGPEHPDTAYSLSNLAELYRNQGKYTEAEPLYRRAFLIYEQQLGPVHPDTAKGLNNLAALYESQGKYAEAEPLYRRALSICEQQLGPAHHGMAPPLNNLAFLYKIQGRYTEAEPLYRRALSICELQLGPAHPNTLFVRENYIALLHTMGRHEEAWMIEYPQK
jgi:tetratricopeptide (TPR) repeat protein/transcriptional regulator with XRE-family HTH domain